MKKLLFFDLLLDISFLLFLNIGVWCIGSDVIGIGLKLYDVSWISWCCLG